LIAQTLVCWAQALLLDGDCKLAEPKTVRFRLWHVAGRIVRHARRLIVGVDRAWPWATDLVTALARLRALPARRSLIEVGSTASRARTCQLPAPGSFVCRLFAAESAKPG
jgi:hypothetical protein